jgi:hypothetical protein
VTAPECRSRAGMSTGAPQSLRMTCIEALADGWIGAPDLCPTCTQAFMTALDGIAGPLTWHRAYTERTMT